MVVWRAMRDPGSTKRHRLVPVLCLLALPGFLLQEEPRKIQEPVSRYGRVYLKEADLAAEVTVERIYHLGMGVDVVRLRVDRELLNRLPEEIGKRKQQLMLSSRDEYREDTGHFLLLKRFSSGDRLITVQRISNLEKFYKDKVAFVETLIRIERLPDVEEKRKALVEFLLLDLKAESQWRKGNSVRELMWFAGQESFRFTTGDVVYIEGIEKDTKQEAFKRSLSRLRHAVAEKAVEGPPLVKEAEERPSDPRHP